MHKIGVINNTNQLFNVVKRFLSFSKDYCAICHRGIGVHTLRDGTLKACHTCHVKLNRRKSGYQRT